MVTIVIGGAASGKSEFAEALVQTLPGQRVYVATMEPYDGECLARIENLGRAMRRHHGGKCGKQGSAPERDFSPWSATGTWGDWRSPPGPMCCWSV